VSARIAPVAEPYGPATGDLLERMMPGGRPPIAMFTTLARNHEMAEAVHALGAYQLSRRLSISLREREIVIDRTGARLGCEYEWGVHVLVFAEKAGLDAVQIRSLTHGTSGDACWTSERERVLIDLVDALCRDHDVDDTLWSRATRSFQDAELLDVIALTGWYHAVSFTARAVRLPLEPGAPRFTDY
jgi:alkylhydroperoxidase family enzyme